VRDGKKPARGYAVIHDIHLDGKVPAGEHKVEAEGGAELVEIIVAVRYGLRLCSVTEGRMVAWSSSLLFVGANRREFRISPSRHLSFCGAVHGTLLLGSAN
jgi:hypothetical protein